MPNVQHKRGTRAALDALAAGSGLLIGQIYVIADEDRIAVATSASTYQSSAKQGEGGGSSPMTGTVTASLPGGAGVFDHEQVMAVAGVTAASRVFLSLAPSLDDDENDPAMTSVNAMSATPGTDQFTILLSFSEPHAGPLKLSYMVA